MMAQGAVRLIVFIQVSSFAAISPNPLDHEYLLGVTFPHARGAAIPESVIAITSVSDEKLQNPPQIYPDFHGLKQILRKVYF
jgi:hypothetical protein